MGVCRYCEYLGNYLNFMKGDFMKFTTEIILLTIFYTTTTLAQMGTMPATGTSTMPNTGINTTPNSGINTTPNSGMNTTPSMLGTSPSINGTTTVPTTPGMGTTTPGLPANQDPHWNQNYPNNKTPGGIEMNPNTGLPKNSADQQKWEQEQRNRGLQPNTLPR